ncbi:50S ribosomal protein L7/L12 [Mesomycoplasma conjunctivae]|uniref:Large ribosomal subunit protein bL12 n=1 Tax=Mesomycoplasma conjunctivae (strain ATCC 25834 / NCTC 10147 / HRC/581) TaxID=572263 RepID=C5J7B6_MESCH|nr:50S ribosomal protein L7/L12 [Mesomycoplasma conjunctivae]CAT05379.1 50S ribosomal protein L7/L12 [Mesomycoplasma conjunctivae]VEU66605.1 50S ribosomal protein L7/L12 [Mesomycoplasma conjunctivae]
MAKITRDQFIESLKEMTIKDVMELVQALKDEFGIDPSAVAVAAAPAQAETKSEVKLTLKSAGASKVGVIKVVKELLNLSLMDAKKLVDAAPSVLKENIKPEEAEELKAKLTEAGAEVSID